jgi:peroxiredoxin
MLVSLLHRLVLVGLACPLAHVSQDLDHSPGQEESAEAVIHEYQEAFSRWTVAYSSATDPGEKAALVETLPRPDQFAPRLLAIVERAPGSDEAFTALAWIYGESKGRELRDEALERLLVDFGDRASIVALTPMLERDQAGTARTALQELAAKSPHAEVRGAMLLATAGWLVRFGTREDRSRCEELLEQVVRDYASAELPGRGTCGEDARRRLFEVRNLLEGCLAPDVEGTALDGASISLADHRGDVVLLTFWASWCTGCMAQVPHERALLEQYAARPFVLLGVNADLDAPEDVLAGAERSGITWRSFQNGSAGLEGPITDRWNVRTLPTTYLIGHDGRIVKRWAGTIARPDELGTSVAAAVAAAEEAADR